MDKKPHKVEEPQASYTAKKPVKTASAAKANDAGVRYLDEASARKLVDRLFSERKNLLHKLAQ